MIFVTVKVSGNIRTTQMDTPYNTSIMDVMHIGPKENIIGVKQWENASRKKYGKECLGKDASANRLSGIVKAMPINTTGEVLKKTFMGVPFGIFFVAQC